jgi:hypothetical protein
VRAVLGYKLGTNRIIRHHPTSAIINKCLGRWMGISTIKVLVGIVSAALHTLSGVWGGEMPSSWPGFAVHGLIRVTISLSR